ncbi:hypothetical protein H1R20_g14940, partial [Candolleomyces eurysporus]
MQLPSCKTSQVASVYATLSKEDLDPSTVNWQAFYRLDPSDIASEDKDPFVVASDTLLRGPFPPSSAGSGAPWNRYAAYVVFNGRLMGVFQSWAATSFFTSGYLRNSQKGYATVEEACDAWDTALVTGVWGDPTAYTEYQPIAPFDGYVVGSANDPRANEFCAKATRIGRFIAEKPEAIRSTDKVAILNPPQRPRSFGTSQPSNFQLQTPSPTPAAHCLLPPSDLPPGSPVRSSKSRMSTLSPSISSESSILLSPLSSPFPSKISTPTRARTAANSPPTPSRRATEARTGFFANSPTRVQLDGTPSRRLTDEDVYYVVIQGHAPGVYLGRTTTHSAAGPSREVQIVKCPNKKIANDTFSSGFMSGQVQKLGD